MSDHKKNIVILTGAGISAESGIQTFRASDGLWCNHRIEEVATPEGFAANPALVHNFYNARRKQLKDPDIQPNPAHDALAKLEREHTGRVLLVTQNVDNLHERAGSHKLIHMHGELNKIRCEKCRHYYEWTDNLDTTVACKVCNSLGTLRPHIVWFGEMPFFMDEIHTALDNCDLFLSIGTSGQVYPAAGFSQIAQARGAKAVELNLDPTQSSDTFDESIHGLASQVVPEFVDKILGL